MRATTGEEDTADRRLAEAAGLAGAQIDMVFQLKKAMLAVGVDVVAD